MMMMYKNLTIIQIFYCLDQIYIVLKLFHFFHPFKTKNTYLTKKMSFCWHFISVFIDVFFMLLAQNTLGGRQTTPSLYPLRHLKTLHQLFTAIKLITFLPGIRNKELQPPTPSYVALYKD